MAALTAAYDAQQKDGELVSYPLAASVKIYKGAIVNLTSAGYATPGADAASVKFIGVAYETSDNTNGAAGAVVVRVWKQGSFVYNKASAVQADLGKIALVVDDNTVATSGTTNSVNCGFVVGLVDSSHLRVRIEEKVN